MNEGLSTVFEFFHSLLRWGVILTVAVAGFVALVGYVRSAPILVWHRMVAIIAMVLCHTQLVVGGMLYGMRFKSFRLMAADQARYWKMEHLGMMLIAIALVTIGRTMSKRATTEQGKQLRIALFYLLALLIFIAMTPWPFTAMGAGRAWV